ncbi:MAG: hypothetical protein WDM91_17335 [Rhizomicrobium sp.]
MNGIPRYLRLLPAVVIVGTAVLAFKGFDIARAAQAAAATADPDLPDNSGLAPTDNRGAAATPDYANADGTSPSAAEVDVLSSLTHRRAELDARARALDMRENLLNAGEGRVDQKIAALKALQTQIQALLAQRDAKQDAQIASLVKTYSTMKPKDAARIFNTLSDDVLLPVAKGMKSDVLAPVLAAMNPDAAQKLTVKLAALLKLPDNAPAAICPTNTADAGTAVPVAAGAPAAPLQTAALGSPPVTLAPPPAATPLPTPPAPPAPAPAPPPAQATTAPVPAPNKPAPRHDASVKPAAPGKPVAAPATKETAAATPPVKPAAPTPAPTAVPATGTPTALAPPQTK